ncbi:MAG TPA: hypothetical protein PLT51_01930 [Candidatus Dojkabacteria bacterium]|nr:hypothetical protein [Candidatus Dojkabacteria bacterium]
MPELIEYLEDGCSLEAVPHTYGCVKVRDTFTIPNTYGFDFPTDFGSTSAADTYFHAVDDGGTTYFFPPATGQPSTPTLATNVAGIQAFLTSIGSGITYTINAFNEIVLTYANPGDESIWSFWMGTSNSSDSWNNKTPPTLHDLRTDSVIYKSVQVVKLKDSEGNYIDRYFSPSTTGPLKEVNLDIFDTFSFGECHECKKEIFATHQRYYVTEGNAIPSNYVAYWVGEIMETWLGQVGADTSNCFIHATDGILNGVADGGVGTDLISPFTATTPGMPLTNVSLVQSMTNISAASMGLSSTDLIYAITNDNQPVWFLSPAAIALLPNNTYLQPYMYFTDTPGTYNKCDINIAAPYTIADVKQTSAQGGQSTCTPIQEIKEKDSCTGLETYRYITEDGTGNLVDINTVIPNFDETKVLLSCPESPILLEKEVCGTIDGSVDTYELIKVYTRNPTTGVSTILFYEDNKGNQITGAVVESCCTCNTLCDVPTVIVPVPNQRCLGYSSNNDPNLSHSRWMISGRYDPTNWVGTCGSAPASFTWELLSCIVNGIELLTTPVVVTVPFASMTLTPAGIPTNYATAFNALPELAGNDIVLEPDMTAYSWNTAKPFLLGFRQYTNDVICTPALTSRIDFIKGGVSDGWDYAISPNLIDMQTKTMSIYNDASIIYPHQPVNSCVAI